MAQQPLPPPPTARDRFDSPAWQSWIMLLVNRLTKAGQILWSQLDFTGSNLTNLATRNHNDLQGMQGGAAGEYNHLTNAQWSAIEGLPGVRLESNADGLSVRNSADTADAPATISKLNVSGDVVEINSDAAGAGADWKYTIRRPTVGMAAAVDLTLPPDDGAAGQVLQTDGAGVLTWVTPSSGSSMKSKTIASAETVTVTTDYELAYSDDLFLDGSIDVAGQAHII